MQKVWNFIHRRRETNTYIKCSYNIRPYSICTCCTTFLGAGFRRGVGFGIHTFNIDVPNSVTYLHWTLIFDCCVVRCISKNRYPKRHLFKWDLTVCSTHENYSKLNSQCNRRDPYDHLMNMRISTVTNEYDTHMNSENYAESGDGLDSDLLTISC